MAEPKASLCDPGLPPQQSHPTPRELALQLAAFKREVELMFLARDEALVLQAAANKIHFEALNHEGARILKATEITVSRDSWDAFLKSFAEWKTTTERTLLGALPRPEFQTYKDSTERALTLKAGEARGAAGLWSLIVAGIGVAGAVVGLFLSLSATKQAPAPQIIYAPASQQTPTSTTTTTVPTGPAVPSAAP